MPSFLVLLSTLQISLWNWRLDVGDGKTVEHLECSREKLRQERNTYLELVCLIYPLLKNYIYSIPLPAKTLFSCRSNSCILICFVRPI